MDDTALSLVLNAAERGQWSEAWTQLEGALNQNQKEAGYEVLCAAGVILARLGRGHESRSHLLRAIAIRPQRPTAYLHLGDALAADGHWRRAVNYYLLAWQADPARPEALNRLTELYAAQGLPYAAKQTARRSLAIDPAQSSVAALLEQVEANFPDRSVTVYVPCYNAAGHIEKVLRALLEQSYPITEILVIDDGSTDDSVARTANYPVRVLLHEANRGLAEARNTALLAATTEFLGHVDSDVVPDRYWLERCLLHFEAERLGRDDGRATGAPLGGVMGRLDELHDVTLADQWRNLHMGQHHGDQRLDEVPHLYGCNSVWRREALLRAGGWDTRYRTNGEDCDASERVRQLGYRLAYEPEARSRHLRRDDLSSVMRTIWRYHTPYYEVRYGLFSTGRVADVLNKLPENLSRHQADWNLDTERRAFHLLYPTFLGLPWRCLSDLKLAASLAPEEFRQGLAETQAAVFIGLFALLAEAGQPEDLLRMVHEDLTSCLPADESLAVFCGWDTVARVLAGERPSAALMAADHAAAGEYLKAIGLVWLKLPEVTWAMVRASAYRLRDEAAAAAGVRPGGPKVAIVNAPWAEDGRIGVRAGSRWPFTQDAHGQRVPCYVPFPFFLSTAAAMLRREGYEVLLVDAIAEGLYTEEFLKRLEGFGPDLVLMETATASHEIDQEWALRFKENLGDQTQVVVCGPHATALGADYLAEAPHVDALLLGEYEPTLVDLLAVLRDGADLTAIAGLIWRDEAGGLHAQTERRPLPALSEFPWPDRLALPMYNYFDSFAGAMPWPNVQMHASRGCPYQCIFCVWPQVVYNGHAYRTRDNADIVAEMTFLVRRYGFKAVYFDDDTFNIKDDRIIDLCDRIAAADLGVPITAMGRADTSSREAFEAMKRAGLVGIKFGVETGDPEMMARIKKHLDLDRVRQAVGWCKELGLGVHLTFSFGGPGETFETARRTIALALDLDPDTVQFSLMTPFPGTVMFEAAERDGTLLTRDWKQFDGARYTVVRGEHLSREELEGLLGEAHWRWHLHTVRRAVLAGAAPPPAEACLAAEELSQAPAGGLGLLTLVTPLQQAADPGALMRAAARKLAPGGLLLCGRGAPEELPGDWQDHTLAAAAVAAGLCQTRAISGFNGELALVFQAQPKPAGSLIAARLAAMLTPAG
jgi:radical SAM superfamily enzyme YgiQ (UPF0313 family)/glycosyltransferase involved in cell wall biosynthesis